MNKVSEEVRIGQEVSVRVLSAEGKLTLSMKPISFLEGKKTPKKSVNHIVEIGAGSGGKLLGNFFRREFQIRPQPHVLMSSINSVLGGGFKSLLFSPVLGEMIQFDEHIFQMGGSTTT